jgi:hypothetical protein
MSNYRQTRELLNAHTKNILNDLGKTWNIERRPQNRTDLVDAIIKQMGNAELVQAQVAKLSDVQRRLLEHIQNSNGVMSTAALRRLALYEQLVVPFPVVRYFLPSSSQGYPEGSFEKEILAVMQTGLVLSPGTPRAGSQYLDLVPRSELRIPEPVLATLPPPPDNTIILTCDPPPHLQPGDAGAFQRDLYLYWSYVRDNPVGITRQGMVSKTHLKRINSILSESEPLDNLRDEKQAGRLRFLRMILMAGRLLKLEGDRLLPETDAETFFMRPLAERVKHAFELYRTMHTWDELLRIDTLTMYGRRAADTMAPSFVVTARQRIIQILAETVGADWQSATQLIELLFRQHYEFLLPRKEIYWGPVNPYTGSGNSSGWEFQTAYEHLGSEGQVVSTFQETPDEEEGWQGVESPFVEMLICEPLHWMGLVDLGSAPMQDDPQFLQVNAFRLSPYGAFVLKGQALPEHTLPVGGRLIVQPTFEVLAAPPIQESHLALLDRIAEREQLDQAATYRLTRGSLYRARQQYGMTIDDVITALERESGSSLPQNVAYTLHDWARAQDRVQFYDNLVLVQADPAMLNRLAATDETLPVRRLTPTSALVAREAYPRLEQHLFALGSLPLVYHPPPNGIPPPAAIPYLKAANDGRLQFQPGAPHVYVKCALQPFTVETGADLQITAAQIQQAIQDGQSIEQIIALLAGWNGGTLPDQLDQALKAWGGFFGSASVERPIILRISDERTLAALQTDPEIGPLLQPYQPAGVLASIEQANLSRLKKLFAARGIDLDDPEAKRRK